MGICKLKFNVKELPVTLPVKEILTLSIEKSFTGSTFGQDPKPIVWACVSGGEIVMKQSIPTTRNMPSFPSMIYTGSGYKFVSTKLSRNNKEKVAEGRDWRKRRRFVLRTCYKTWEFFKKKKRMWGQWTRAGGELGWEWSLGQAKYLILLIVPFFRPTDYCLTKHQHQLIRQSSKTLPFQLLFCVTHQVWDHQKTIPANTTREAENKSFLPGGFPNKNNQKRPLDLTSPSSGAPPPVHFIVDDSPNCWKKKNIYKKRKFWVKRTTVERV